MEIETHSLFLTSDPTMDAEIVVNEQSLGVTKSVILTQAVAHTSSGVLAVNSADVDLNMEFWNDTLMIGDHVKFSAYVTVNGDANWRHVFASIKSIYRGFLEMPSGVFTNKPENHVIGRAVTHIQLNDVAAASKIAEYSPIASWAPGGKGTWSILSHRAFTNDADENGLTCKLPYPMRITKLELDAYFLSNLETHDELRPGKHTGNSLEFGNTGYGNIDHHDYFILKTPDLPCDNTLSNHPVANNQFGIISAYSDHDDGVREGTTLNVYNKNVGISQSYDSTQKFQKIRLQLVDRRNRPVKCHRAHFWFTVTEAK